jgi:hypothetical protein
MDMWLKILQLIACVINWMKEAFATLLASSQKSDERLTRMELEAKVSALRLQIKDAEARLFSPLLNDNEWEDLRAQRANLTRLYAELYQQLESKHYIL